MLKASYRGNGVFRTSEGFAFGAADDFFVVPRSAIEDVSAVSFQKAVDRAWDNDKIFAAELLIADVPEAGFDPMKVPFGDLADVRIDFSDGDASVIINTPFTVEDPDQSFYTWVPEVLVALLDRLDATVAVGPDPYESEEFSIVAWITMPPTGRSVADFLKAGEDAKALVEAVAADGPIFDLDMAVELVKTGHARALIGQPENDWLDGKRSPYILNLEKQKIEFAKDVTSFANSEKGGLLLVGARTQALKNGDQIVAIDYVNLTVVNVPQMRAILRERVFPPIQGLEILTVESSPGYGVVLVHVPSQSPNQRPFLVRGAVTRQGVLAHHVSIPVRSGEDTTFSTVHEIHALIQAGRIAHEVQA